MLQSFSSAFARVLPLLLLAVCAAGTSRLRPRVEPGFGRNIA